MNFNLLVCFTVLLLWTSHPSDFPRPVCSSWTSHRLDFSRPVRDLRGRVTVWTSRRPVLQHFMSEGGKNNEGNGQDVPDDRSIESTESIEYHVDMAKGTMTIKVVKAQHQPLSNGKNVSKSKQAGHNGSSSKSSSNVKQCQASTKQRGSKAQNFASDQWNEFGASSTVESTNKESLSQKSTVSNIKQSNASSSIRKQTSSLTKRNGNGDSITRIPSSSPVNSILTNRLDQPSTSSPSKPSEVNSGQPGQTAPSASPPRQFVSNVVVTTPTIPIATSVPSDNSEKASAVEKTDSAQL